MESILPILLTSENLEKAGLVVIALSFVLTNFALFKANQKTINNHMNHNTQALTKLCEGQDDLKDGINDFKEAIRELVSFLKAKKK